MKSFISLAAVVAVAGAASSVSAYLQVTLQDVLVSSARFAAPPESAARVGLHNLRSGRYERTHTAAIGVRSLVQQPGDVMGDGSVLVMVPGAAAPPERSFFDVFLDDAPQPGGSHFFRFFGDLTGPEPTNALIGLLLPAVQKVRDSAARIKTSILQDNGLFQNLTWDIEVLVPGGTIGDIDIAPAADSFFDVFFDVQLPAPSAAGGLAIEPVLRITLTGEESSVPAPGAAALLAGAGILAARRRR
ncbi:MAG: hypothetical protein ACKVS8_04310 [Phycisphaerales bacterium]